MVRTELLAILLHFVVHVVNGNESMGSMTSSITNENSYDDVMITDQWHQNDCMTRNCLYGKYYVTSNLNVSKAIHKSHQIHLAVLLPSKPVDDVSERSTQILATTLPVIELAIRSVKEKKILDGYELIIHHRDTQCSSTVGPLAAFDLYNRHEADVFLGPICDYVLAPVARYASIWRRPVLTTGGLASAFNNKVRTINLLVYYESRSFIQTLQRNTLPVGVHTEKFLLTHKLKIGKHAVWRQKREKNFNCENFVLKF